MAVVCWIAACMDAVISVLALQFGHTLSLVFLLMFRYISVLPHPHPPTPTHPPLMVGEGGIMESPYGPGNLIHLYCHTLYDGA